MAEERVVPPVIVLKDQPADPRTKMDVSPDTSHATGRGRVIQRNAPILVQRQSADDRMGPAEPLPYDGTSSSHLKPVRHPVPTVETPTAAPAPRMTDLPLELRPAPVEAKAPTSPPVRRQLFRVVFQSDAIGRMQIRCLHAVVSEGAVALGFEADGDIAEPPAKGLAEPLSVTITDPRGVTSNVKAAHCGLSFEVDGVYWLVLARMPKVSDE